MPNGDRREPVPSSRFTIAFEGVIVGAFQEASGLSVQNDVVEYKASGEKGQFINYKIPANPIYGNITLKRGVTDAMDLWEWRNLIDEGKYKEARKNGSVVLYDQNSEEVARWNFENAWPTKLTGPSFNAASNDVAIEELEITAERYYRVKK